MTKRNRGWSRAVGVRKLEEASFFLQQLREAEGVTAGYFLSAFLSASRSVANALEKRRKTDYSTWRRSRTNAERALLNFMTTERDDETHEAGARRGVTIVVPVATFITFDYLGENQPAIPLCEKYLVLLGQALDAVYP